jgi:hypothetical protein
LNAARHPSHPSPILGKGLRQDGPGKERIVPTKQVYFAIAKENAVSFGSALAKSFCGRFLARFLAIFAGRIPRRSAHGVGANKTRLDGSPSLRDQ